MLGQACPWETGILCAHRVVQADLVVGELPSRTKRHRGAGLRRVGVAHEGIDIFRMHLVVLGNVVLRLRLLKPQFWSQRRIASPNQHLNGLGNK